MSEWVNSLSRVRLFATPWTVVAYQAPPSMGFSRQEYRSGLPLPSPSHELQGVYPANGWLLDQWNPNPNRPDRPDFLSAILLWHPSHTQAGLWGRFSEWNAGLHSCCAVCLAPFLLILVSYGKIISTILKLPSATSRGKAFSTCSSHLTAVALFFRSGLVTYLRPKTQGSAESDKVLSLFYTIVTPVFNPMIYSLRNKDVMMALRQWPCKYLSSLKNWLVFQKLISYIFVINFQHLS